MGLGVHTMFLLLILVEENTVIINPIDDTLSSLSNFYIGKIQNGRHKNLIWLTYPLIVSINT